MASADEPNGKILIVEDEPAFREALAEILRDNGYSTTAAANGEEALSYLRSHPPPSLIILNLVMPVMNGWAFMAERGHDPSLAAIPVVILSGISDVGREADSLHAAAYLTKPVEIPALLDTVERCSR
jgi:two-component system, chemotaxis family, chemotaxis protein CheY